MATFLVLLAAFLVVNVLGGLVRALHGPTRADRALAATLVGTTGAATLLLLAEALGLPALRDLALVVVLVAAVPIAVFRHRVRQEAA